MGKGDVRRPSSIPKKEYDENFVSIFGEKKLNIWEEKDEDKSEREGTPKCIPDQAGEGEAEA